MRRRSNINLKLIAQMLGKAGFNHIITVDMHSKESQGFFDSAIDNLRASPFLIQYIQESVSNKILKWHFSFLWCILFIFFKLKFSELQDQDHMNSPRFGILIPSPQGDQDQSVFRFNFIEKNHIVSTLAELISAQDRIVI